MTNLKLKVYVSGAIFDDGTLSRDVIDPAMERASELGLRRIRYLTPERTGRARREWYIEKTDPIVITNPVEYVQYLEFGTYKMEAVGMASKSIPYIEQQIGKEITKRLKALS